MFVEVSIGEALDKLCILELKMKKINDENKKKEIQKEINALSECKKSKKDYVFYYDLLFYVNEIIWDKTEIMKKLTVTDSNFSTISNDIFEFNQKRFRIKNWLNLLSESTIKEQKSYGLSCCQIVIKDEKSIHNKIPEINYLALEYDSVIIVSNCENKLKHIFKTPTIDFSNKMIHTNKITKNIVLEDFELFNDRDIFEFTPLKYISGGLLGDFIHQLSIIKEKFLKKGRKGILYISNTVGDPFKKGLETAYTDTYQLVIEQEYIKDYKMFNNESYDIDLSHWRHSNLLFNASWFTILNNVYNVNWGEHAWINVKKDSKWQNNVLVNVSQIRPSYNIDYNEFFNKYDKNILFVSFQLDDYNHFKKQYNVVDDNNIHFYQLNSLYELCVAIYSCKFFIGNFSSPLAFAYAMHANSVVGIGQVDFIFHKDLDKHISNLLIEEDVQKVLPRAIELFDSK
jgi:hypothetical protein